METTSPVCVYVREERIYHQYTLFSGGEPHVEITMDHDIGPDDIVVIDARITSSNVLMETLLLTDALKRWGAKRIRLFCPYFPGARQDRVLSPGFGFTAKVYADILNAQGYEKVTVVDPHSYVTPALLNNCAVVGIEQIVPHITPKDYYQFLVAPDAGAVKKVQALGEVMKLPVISCSKVRDEKTGKLTKCVVNADIIELSSFERGLVVDDICDGGATFINIAKAFGDRKWGIWCASLDLYVTHGIFSRGTKTLLKHYTTIYTTDSFPRDYDRNVFVAPLNHWGF